MAASKAHTRHRAGTRDLPAMRWFAAAASIVLLSAGVALPAAAASAVGGVTWFVSGSGSDGNTGRTSASPFRSMVRVLGFARPGDTIDVMSGSYGPFTVSQPDLTITAEAGATVYGNAISRDTVLVSASNVSITGLDVQHCTPNANPGAGIDYGASSGIRIGPGTSGVLLDHVTVREGHGTTPEGLPFGCHGIELDHTAGGTVSNSNVFDNADGIFVAGGSGAVLKGNTLHDNTYLYKNTTTPSDDAGGEGVSLINANGVTISGNTLYDNGGPSHDYGTKGGAFDNWQSSNITITANKIYNNFEVLTTGAANGGDCANNTFTGNTASGRTTGSPFTKSLGLQLRCANAMTVSGNTLSNFDWWTFWLYQPSTGGGTINNLTITGNTITQGYDQIYALGTLPTTPLIINNNNYTYKGAVGTLANGTQIRTLSTWTTTTGYDEIQLPTAPHPSVSWYVSGLGSDGNTGRSASSAFRGVPRALDFARSGDTIIILAGNYAPFSILTPGVRVIGEAGAIVSGNSAARDVVFIGASGVSLTGLTVRNCVPNSSPPVGGIGWGASSQIRVGPGTTNVTLDHLTVANSHGTTSEGLPFGCYGIELDHSTNDMVTNSDISHNGTGIAVFYGGTGTVIKNNNVHDNDREMNNTLASGDDWGGNGIAFSNASGVTAMQNTIVSNGGPSHDFGVDGGAFEIWQSSNIAMTGNSISNNVDILETGAGGTGDCFHNSFTGNIAVGRTSGSNFSVSAGMILRCANGMTVSGNTLSNLDWWTFWIYQRQANGSNGGSISGLALEQNSITQTDGQVYSLGSQATSANIGVNNNRYNYYNMLGTTPAGTHVTSMAVWRASTGFDAVQLAAPTTTGSSAVGGVTWFVSGSGSDGNTGRTSASPFRSMVRVLGFARPGDTIDVMSGSYGPFTVSQPDLTITAEAGATVYGNAISRDTVLVSASNVSITGLDVQHCTPNANPGAGIDYGASSGIRIGPGTSGVLLDHVTVREGHGTTPEGLPFGCHGIELDHTAGGTVSNSNVFDNADGIFVAGGSGAVLKGNTLHDNTYLYKNTTTPSDDAGGEGVSLINANGVTISGNTLYDNGGPSHDYGTKGGAFDNWQSSNITITANKIYNNFEVLTTGAANGGDCANNTFTGNTASGRTTGSPFTKSLGLQLRCANAMTVSGNTLSNFDWWTFWLYQPSTGGGTINNLTITGNTITQGYDQIYALGTLPTTPLIINNNNYTYKGAVGTLANGTQIRTLSTWTTTTGAS